MLFNIVPKSRLTESSAFICCIMLSQLCSGGQKYDAIAFLANMCFVLFVSSFKVPAVFWPLQRPVETFVGPWRWAPDAWRARIVADGKGGGGIGRSPGGTGLSVQECPRTLNAGWGETDTSRRNRCHLSIRSWSGSCEFRLGLEHLIAEVTTDWLSWFWPDVSLSRLSDLSTQPGMNSLLGAINIPETSSVLAKGYFFFPIIRFGFDIKMYASPSIHFHEPHSVVPPVAPTSQIDLKFGGHVYKSSITLLSNKRGNKWSCVLWWTLLLGNSSICRNAFRRGGWC